MAGSKLQPDDVVIARVIKARGIRGEVACDIETDFPERFESLEQVTMQMPDGSRPQLTVEDCWFHKNRVILRFADYDTRNLAEELVGGLIVIPEAAALELEDGEFYEYQIVGSEAVTPDGKVLGKVTRLIRTGGTDVLVIESEDRRERLVPFADDICSEVDLDARRITVNPPEGLLEVNK
ncbi:MAG TPA: ribosome maturation factor RimM [Blastocatellia bacterium]|nr:ribosome maturation factor RimM [Blastocatellia bacterium]